MKTGLAIRTNQYPATCATCAQHVPAGEGALRQGKGRWYVVHLDDCPEAPAPLEAGIYVVGEQIVKLQASRETKRLYGKVLSPIGGRRLTEAGEQVQWEFLYAPGAVKEVKERGEKMSKAAAMEFGIRYGICCQCGRGLKDATSVAAGIGPTCIKKFA